MLEKDAEFVMWGGLVTALGAGMILALLFGLGGCNGSGNPGSGPGGKDDFENPYNNPFAVKGNTGVPSIKWYTNNRSAVEFHLYSADDLAGLAILTRDSLLDFAEKTLILDNDVELTYTYGRSDAAWRWNNGKGWVTIGGEYGFAGAFDGNYKKISGLYKWGFIGVGERGMVKNLGMVNMHDVYDGIVIYNAGTVTNCYSTGTADGGGLVGLNVETGIVKNSYSIAYVDGGSLIGNNRGTSVDNVELSDGSPLLLNGVEITIEEINADGTFGGRFTAENGWATENGKLPGFGTPEEMPEHLRL